MPPCRKGPPRTPGAPAAAAAAAAAAAVAPPALSNESGKGEKRSGLFRLLDKRFLPPPAKVKQTVDDLVLDEGGQFLDLPVNLALRLSTTLKDFLQMPYDYFCPTPDTAAARNITKTVAVRDKFVYRQRNDYISRAPTMPFEGNLRAEKLSAARGRIEKQSETMDAIAKFPGNETDGPRGDKRPRDGTVRGKKQQEEIDKMRHYLTMSTFVCMLDRRDIARLVQDVHKKIESSRLTDVSTENVLQLKSSKIVTRSERGNPYKPSSCCHAGDRKMFEIIPESLDYDISVHAVNTQDSQTLLAGSCGMPVENCRIGILVHNWFIPSRFEILSDLQGKWIGSLNPSRMLKKLMARLRLSPGKEA
nr:unnamed protein product [Callosobruchus chinensis]